MKPTGKACFGLCAVLLTNGLAVQSMLCCMPVIGQYARMLVAVLLLRASRSNVAHSLNGIGLTYAGVSHTLCCAVLFTGRIGLRLCLP